MRPDWPKLANLIQKRSANMYIELKSLSLNNIQEKQCWNLTYSEQYSSKLVYFAEISLILNRVNPVEIALVWNHIQAEHIYKAEIVLILNNIPSKHVYLDASLLILNNIPVKHVYPAEIALILNNIPTKHVYPAGISQILSNILAEHVKCESSGNLTDP